jgi:cysteine-rich repeat protein
MRTSNASRSIGRGRGIAVALAVAIAFVATAAVMVVPTPALAANATVTALGFGLRDTVRGHIGTDSTRTYGFVGVFHITIDGGAETDAYCVDMRDVIRVGDSEPQVPPDYACEVVFVLNNTFPRPNAVSGRLGDTNREAAAVQSAIWSFTDRFTVTSPSDVVARVAQIVGAARSTCGAIPPVPQSLTITPSSAVNYLPGDATHTLIATLTGTDRMPLASYPLDVVVAGAAGPQNFHGGTNAAGQLTVAYDNTAVVTGTDTITATARFVVPVGLEFKRAGKQGIVLAGQPRPGSVVATAAKTWAPARCGDGVLNQSGEQCDDGNAVDGDGCDTNCTPTRCGNGIVTAGEECDDANAASGDGCDVNCTPTSCGNGVVSIGEECDDGNAVDGDGCDGNCTVPRCGNGVVTAGEECDDGNLVNGDSCDNNCTIPRCGNGIVSGGEECDDGNLVDGDACDGNCTAPRCGNGVVTAGEECDDGNLVDGDGCDVTCTVTRCGNGVVTAGEECDDGNLVDGDGCESDCTSARCGNGVVDRGEQCDDGNTAGGDGCSPTCRLQEICGDLTDNDGDGLVDCDDPDCPTCLPIFQDPAKIQFKEKSPDVFDVHGRVVPQASADPRTRGLGIVVTNADGVVYRAFLSPGDLAGSTPSFLWFADRTARHGRGLRAGIYRMTLRTRRGHYFFRLRSYGDLSRATLPVMTVQFLLGDETFSSKSEWKRTRTGWKTDFEFSVAE